ncbi:MAG: hypothetical protein P8K73_05610 [Methylophilaceae bacterium]|nr:hypothetical protein [Methylophilaceae bacterium]
MKSKFTFLMIFFFLGNPLITIADHNLREIERRCEVEWDGDEGELDCRYSVSDRRNLERRCEVEEDGEFDCRGSHYRNVERKCEADRDGDINC